MYEFKINNEVKTKIARDLKKEFKKELINCEYAEKLVMYSHDKQEFFIAETYKQNELEYYGNVHYKTIVKYKADKEPITIKSLISEIFG